MANRFPLIVNPTTKEIQEIAQNDNLDLTGNGIYAGGSLGQNGQVLTTNGTTVEWRTLSGGGGGSGSGGIDSNTTYIIEAEDQLDGASLNLVAGGTGIGTIRLKFLDNNEFQFDTVDSLTIAPQLKSGGIVNDKLENPGYTFIIDGVNTPLNLGSTVNIPIYGDVFKTATQVISNKTFTNCTISLSPSTGNTIVSIPNSSLLNQGININGELVELGGSIVIDGGGGVISDNDTTYTLSSIDWSENGVNNPTKKAIRLTGSDASTSNAVLVAGTGLTVSRNGDEIEFTNTDADTDTDTTYDITTDSFLQGAVNAGSRINLNATSNNVKTGETSAGNIDNLNLRNGTGVTVNSISDSDIQFSIGQDVSTSSNVQFNTLTLTGNFTVEGATTFVDSTNLVITDKTITIGDGATSSLLANGAGLLIGTSNINFTYIHNNESWTSTTDIDVAPTKSYKVGGNEVLTSNKVLGKTMPLGNVIGSIDSQTLSNKTIQSPVMTEIINTGTVYFPSPPIADTLVGRATSDILTNKSIDGNNNTLTNIGNSSIALPYMIINGTTRNLGETFTVESADPYNDEKAQDAVAGSLTSGIHTGITFAYDDTTGRINATVSGGGGGGAETDTLDSVTGRGATTTNNIEVGNLDASGLSARDDILTLGASSATFTINFSQNTGASPQIRNTATFGADSGLGIYGAYSGGGTHLEDIFLGTSGSRSKFKNLDPQSDVTYDLGSSTKKWNNIYAGNVESDSFVKNGGTSSEYLMADGSVNSSLTMGGSMTSNIIPDTNDAYDIGSASYKIRDIYEADPSDIRLKTDVVSYTGGLKFVESLRVVDFTWKEDVDVKAGKRETGLIAQEVKEALDASNYNSWRLHTDGDMQGIDKKQLIPALVSAIQELSAEIKELKKSCNNHL